MSGPLEELRRAIIENEVIDVDAKSVIIGGSKRLDRSEPTTFHSMRGRGQAYLLGSVFFQFKFRDKPYNDYVQSCRKERVAHVTPLDKRDLLAYLTGEIETCANIVSTEAAPPTAPSGTGRAASAALVPIKDGAKGPGQDLALTSAPATEKDQSSFASQRKTDRDQRALDSVLMVAEWDFSDLREKLARHVAIVRSGKQVPSENGAKHGTAPAYDPRGDRYTSTEDRFWRENLGPEFQELGIDMGGSFKEKPTSANANGPTNEGSSRSKRERPGGRQSTGAEVSAKRIQVDPKELIPIIIVPAGSTTLVYSGNIVEFLQNGRFLSTEQLAKSKAARVSSGRMRVVRTPGGNCSRAEYQIVSNPNRLVRAEWERVVAVVCSGQEWQFKNWPINERGVADLFRKVQGFFFQYDDVSTTGNVDSWAIKKLSLSRGKRHTDGQVQVQFWNCLDGFMRRKGKQLRY